MFNLKPINNQQLSQSIGDLVPGTAILLFPYAELIRIAPDQLNEYRVEEKIECKSMREGKWNGSLYTMNLRNDKIPTNNLLVSGILCINDDNQNSPLFWFDLSDHSITEVQCFKFISTLELVIVLLQQKGNGKEKLLEVLCSSI